MRLASYRSALPACLAAMVLVGCGASASKRYEQGLELQRQGQYVEAAQKYIEALRKDPEFAQARTSLREVGPLAVADLHRSAIYAAESGRAPDAADGYLRLDGFLESAADVGEPLAAPADYPALRRETFDSAIELLIETGQVAAESGEWYAAMRSYERAERYFPNSGQVRQLLEGMIATQLGWCQFDLDRGRYRSALAHADHAYDLAAGSDPESARSALDLRASAIELGTIPVAVTPVWRTDDAARFLPDGFATALNDELELSAWSDPPLFIEVLDPREVRRALRDLRYHASLLSVPEAARLGRSLGVDAVLAGSIDLFTITERDVREELRNATTTGGDSVTYLRRSGYLDYRLVLRYDLVEPETRRRMRERTVELTESGRFERAVYDGDWRSLQLTRNERRWFEEDRQREFTMDIEESLLAEAVIAFGDQAYRDLGRMVD